MKKEVFKLAGRTIVNQNRAAYQGPSADVYLEYLLRVVTVVEAFTGHAWKVTSFIRDSPNHQTACALDIAPVIAPTSRRYYAVYNHSDPVLYKRRPLMRALQDLAREMDPAPYTLGLFVEPDHIHLQIFKAEGNPHIRVAKWKGPKDVYPDTRARMELPMTDQAYSC